MLCALSVVMLPANRENGCEILHERSGESEKSAKHSTPGRNRTCNLRIRSPLLYPFELRARVRSACLRGLVNYSFCRVSDYTRHYTGAAQNAKSRFQKSIIVGQAQ
jgi:hypothetical protein